jgi:tRNA A-37 threonylcarbamoyl transferase component Bud32
MKHRVVGCVALFHDDDKNGVIMERIPVGPDGEFPQDLALPPTIKEITADRWIETTSTSSSRRYDSTFIWNAVTDVISAVSFLHEEVGVAHGDLYAHNMKVDHSGHLWLLDFGASWTKGSALNASAEKLEVRAVGILLNELLHQQVDGDTQKGKKLRQFLQSLAESCLNEDVDQRPSLYHIRTKLDNFGK